MHELSLKILEAMTIALKVDVKFFSDRFAQPISALRMIHYPPQKNNLNASIAAGEHTDYGCITLLYQDDVGGFQVRRAAGDWLDAPHIPGTLVVNIGYIMARWTNDRYRSTHTELLVLRIKIDTPWRFLLNPIPKPSLTVCVAVTTKIILKV